FYLPFNENWPVNLYAHFTPSYWAEEGFSPAYAEALEDAFKQFARHVNENNWDRTVFQFYLNNKISYRENGNISGAPWLLGGHPVNLLHKPFPQTAAAPFTPPSIEGHQKI
ncbi:MAG: hypothetical protein LC657_04255, partial [Desulfobacteraceae bacterium]|nr:hypothetical protein [Desulfobacteraceae bacterium]